MPASLSVRLLGFYVSVCKNERTYVRKYETEATVEADQELLFRPLTTCAKYAGTYARTPVTAGEQKTRKTGLVFQKVHRAFRADQLAFADLFGVRAIHQKI